MNKVREYKLRILDGVICALEEKRESFVCVGIEWSGYAIRTEIDVSEHPAVITAQHQLTAWVNNLSKLLTQAVSWCWAVITAGCSLTSISVRIARAYRSRPFRRVLGARDQHVGRR
jgi:hypothetical protein